MQVLNYQTAPIANEGIQKQIIQQSIDSIQQQIKEPVRQIFNSTFNTINQTIKQVIEKGDAQKTLQSISEAHDFQEDWNFLYFLRLFFYIIVILKIVELIFSKRRKIDIKERVYRKYVFSHAQMIREFNDDDRKVMETTLKNTIKNASMEKNNPKIAKKLTSKKVNFHETKNEYFEPKKSQQNNVGMSSLQAFLSRSVEKEQMQRQQEQQGEEQQLEIIEALFQNNQLEESDICFENQKTDELITSIFVKGSSIQQQNSQINQSEETYEQKQKDQ